MRNHQNLLAAALSASLALLAAAAPLRAQSGDSIPGTRSPSGGGVLELENAVPGWECPMPVAGLGREDPSAPSGMPIVPIDSMAAVPMPTLRRHCLNPRAVPGTGPGGLRAAGDRLRLRSPEPDVSPGFPRDLFDRPRPVPADTAGGLVPSPDPDG